MCKYQGQGWWGGRSQRGFKVRRCLHTSPESIFFSTGELSECMKYELWFALRYTPDPTDNSRTGSKLTPGRVHPPPAFCPLFNRSHFAPYVGRKLDDFARKKCSLPRFMDINKLELAWTLLATVKPQDCHKTQQNCGFMILSQIYKVGLGIF